MSSSEVLVGKDWLNSAGLETTQAPSPSHPTAGTCSVAMVEARCTSTTSTRKLPGI